MVYGSTLPAKCPGCYKGTIWTKVGESFFNDGYSMKKGLLGTALFGPVGAVAGINGKKNKLVQYRCRHCGYIYVHTYKPGQY